MDFCKQVKLFNEHKLESKHNVHNIKEINYGGYAKVFSYENDKIVKYQRFTDRRLLSYTLQEINTGLKANESKNTNGTENLAIIDSCCFFQTQSPKGVVYEFFLLQPNYKYGDLRDFLSDIGNI